MIDLAPFETPVEQEAYCSAASVPFEGGAIGFKFFSGEKKLGLCQLKLVGGAAYVLSLAAITSELSEKMLANVFSDVVQFLQSLGVVSVIYPIQNETDRFVAETLGFDRVSPTLYVFDYPEAKPDDHASHHCDGSCDCHHHHE